MPVTAKLSQKFYEKLGDEVANELVNWFNAVDTAYRADLREMNELNYARFEAKLEQRLSEYDARWERRFAQVTAEFATVRTEMAVLRSDLLKWMFVYWAASVATTVGLVVTVVRLGS